MTTTYIFLTCMLLGTIFGVVTLFQKCNSKKEAIFYFTTMGVYLIGFLILLIDIL
jgi:hypothetical protein